MTATRGTEMATGNKTTGGTTTARGSTAMGGTTTSMGSRATVGTTTATSGTDDRAMFLMLLEVILFYMLNFMSNEHFHTGQKTRCAHSNCSMKLN